MRLKPKSTMTRKAMSSRIPNTSHPPVRPFSLTIFRPAKHKTTWQLSLNPKTHVFYRRCVLN